MADENVFARFSGARKRLQPASETAQPNRIQPPAHEPQSEPTYVPVPSSTDADSESEGDDDLLLLESKKVSPTSRVASPPPEVTRSLDTLPWNGRAVGRKAVMNELHHALLTHLVRNPDELSTFEPFMTSKAYKEVRNFSGVPTFSRALVPPVMKSALGDMALREYQRFGVQVLLDNLRLGKSTILADDMGLGKTAQVSSFLHILRKLFGAPGPHLVVCPVSTAGSWARELGRWCPLLRVVRYRGPNRTHLQRVMSGVFVVSASTLLNDKGFFLKRTWQVCVFDEAHALRGRASSIADLCPRIDAAFRIAVTGTPVSVSPAELWSIMRFLYPSFGRRLQAPTDAEMSQEEHKQTAAILRSVMIRRTKESMDLGLPPRRDHAPVAIEMPRVQEELYHAVVAGAISEDATGMSNVLMNLRRACGHPWMFRLHCARGSNDSALTGLQRLRIAGVSISPETLVEPSGKMKALDEMLHSLRDQGHRVLLFSGFTAQLDLFEGLCDLRGFTFGRLDGNSLRSERELLMARFNHPSSKIFCLLISTTAGGVGITLTGADTVIIYDSQFNPQMDRQAADRAHRLGQTRPVNVYRFSLQHTIDERIVRLSAARAGVGDRVVDGANGGDVTFQRQLIDSVLKDASVQKFDEDVSSEGAKLLAAVSRPPLAEFQRGVQQSNRAVFDMKDCFECGGSSDHRLSCPGCNKWYHPNCAHGRSSANSSTWRCRRHRCAECGDAAGAEDIIFMCTTCPQSFCYNCLDERYISMEGTVDGLTFQHIATAYNGMADDGVMEKRSVMFISCPDCGGVGHISDSESGSSIESSDTE